MYSVALTLEVISFIYSATFFAYAVQNPSHIYATLIPPDADLPLLYCLIKCSKNKGSASIKKEFLI